MGNTFSSGDSPPIALPAAGKVGPKGDKGDQGPPGNPASLLGTDAFNNAVNKLISQTPRTSGGANDNYYYAGADGHLEVKAKAGQPTYVSGSTTKVYGLDGSGVMSSNLELNNPNALLFSGKGGYAQMAAFNPDGSWNGFVSAEKDGGAKLVSGKGGYATVGALDKDGNVNASIRAVGDTGLAGVYGKNDDGYLQIRASDKSAKIVSPKGEAGYAGMYAKDINNNTTASIVAFSQGDVKMLSQGGGIFYAGTDGHVEVKPADGQSSYIYGDSIKGVTKVSNFELNNDGSGGLYNNKGAQLKMKNDGSAYISSNGGTFYVGTDGHVEVKPADGQSSYIYGDSIKGVTKVSNFELNNDGSGGLYNNKGAQLKMKNDGSAYISSNAGGQFYAAADGHLEVKPSDGQYTYLYGDEIKGITKTSNFELNNDGSGGIYNSKGAQLKMKNDGSAYISSNGGTFYVGPLGHLEVKPASGQYTYMYGDTVKILGTNKTKGDNPPYIELDGAAVKMIASNTGTYAAMYGPYNNGVIAESDGSVNLNPAAGKTVMASRDIVLRSPDKGIYGIEMQRTDEDNNNHRWKFWNMKQQYGKNNLSLWEYSGNGCVPTLGPNDRCGPVLSVESMSGNTLVHKDLNLNGANSKLCIGSTCVDEIKLKQLLAIPLSSSTTSTSAAIIDPCASYKDTDTNVSQACYNQIWRSAGCPTNAVTMSSWHLSQTKKGLIDDSKAWATMSDDLHRNLCYGTDKTKWPPAVT